MHHDVCRTCKKRAWFSPGNCKILWRIPENGCSNRKLSFETVKQLKIVRRIKQKFCVAPTFRSGLIFYINKQASAFNLYKMKDHHFEIELQVRDYECDIQGIVNNAVYQNYLEHCRHKFLNFAGLDFAQLHNEGIDAVVIRAELDYKFPLRPGDDFLIRLKMAKQGRLRIIFNQQIILKTNEKLMVNAKITAVLTRAGRPVVPDVLVEKFKEIGIVLEEN